jgi:hypothetical protein
VLLSVELLNRLEGCLHHHLILCVAEDFLYLLLLIDVSFLKHAYFLWRARWLLVDRGVHLGLNYVEAVLHSLNEKLGENEGEVSSLFRFLTEFVPDADAHFLNQFVEVSSHHAFVNLEEELRFNLDSLRFHIDVDFDPHVEGVDFADEVVVVLHEVLDYAVWRDVQQTQLLAARLPGLFAWRHELELLHFLRFEPAQSVVHIKFALENPVDFLNQHLNGVSKSVKEFRVTII